MPPPNPAGVAPWRSNNNNINLLIYIKSISLYKIKINHKLDYNNVIIKVKYKVDIRLIFYYKSVREVSFIGGLFYRRSLLSEGSAKTQRA